MPIQKKPHLLENLIRSCRTIHTRPRGSFKSSFELLCNMAKQADIEYLTPEIHDICSIVRNCNGGAKPSGAGGGDCVVAFFENKEQRTLPNRVTSPKLSNHRL